MTEEERLANIENCKNKTPEEIIKIETNLSPMLKKLDKEFNYFNMELNNLVDHALHGYSGAEYVLGLRYLNGVDVEVDYAKAYAWFYNSAKHNNLDGTFNLAICHIKGVGTVASKTLGLQYMEKAANLGHMEATKFLYSTYIHGNKAEQQKAIYVLKRAAEDNNIDEAYYILAKEYIKGDCVKKDINQAIKYFDRCCKISNNGKLVCVCAHDLTEIDFNKYKDNIFKYVTKSNELNYPESFFYHAWLLIQENKYPVDYKKIYTLIEKAKSLGVNIPEIDKIIAFLNKNVCPNCKQRFTMQEKQGLFGKKIICTNCNKSWKR